MKKVQKTAFQTEDGKEFETETLAKEHEATTWLMDKAFDDDEEAYIYGPEELASYLIEKKQIITEFLERVG